MTGWGARGIGPERTLFRIWAPDRREMALEIAGREPVTMARAEDGWFAAETAAGPGVRYRFRLDTGLAVPDPASRRQDGGVHGWSVVTDPGGHVWQTAGWRGRPWEEAVIQEVHVGLLGGFAGVERHLPHLVALGVTAIQMMPIGAFGGLRNWGYDGVLPFAVAESYGTPGELKALIDRAHALGLMVFLDVVYNHFGPDGNCLGAYAAGFFDAETHTPWGGAVAVEKPPVQAFFLENARMWIGEYRFDGLRFDAVHAIGNRDFLRWLAGGIRRHFPGRHIHLMLENEHNDAGLLSPDAYDAQWNDDFHNVLHVLLTGETDAYYGDFADCPAQKLARCLTEGFIYQGEVSPGQGRPRGTASAHLPPTAFISFLQNHDQTGNRAFGERLTLLAEPAKLRAATALLLLAPQIPLIFMGDETGSRTPFLFFTDFHDELADAVREGRRREFAKFADFIDPAARERIPDPNAPETFMASRTQPGPDAAEWNALYRHLLALRHAEIIPRLKGARAMDAAAISTGAVVARWRLGDGATLGIVLNLGDKPVAFPDPPRKPLFAAGKPGDAGSFSMWIAP